MSKKYYLMFTQGQGSEYDGPYSKRQIIKKFALCLGGMSVGIGKLKNNGKINFISKQELSDILDIPLEKINKPLTIGECLKLSKELLIKYRKKNG